MRTGAAEGHLIKAGKAHGRPQIKVLLNASSLQVPLHGCQVQVVAAQCHSVFCSHFSVHPSSCRHTRACELIHGPRHGVLQAARPKARTETCQQQGSDPTRDEEGLSSIYADFQGSRGVVWQEHASLSRSTTVPAHIHSKIGRDPRYQDIDLHHRLIPFIVKDFMHSVRQS